MKTDSGEIEELVELIDSTSNMLRGMTMDPAIPKHAKDAMWSRIAQLEAVVEAHVNPQGEPS